MYLYNYSMLYDGGGGGGVGIKAKASSADDILTPSCDYFRL